MAAASVEEQKQLAALAKTSRAHLYHLSAGRRVCGPDLALALENASRELRTTNDQLPVLQRTELCPACGRCEYAKRCAAAEAMAKALMPGLMHEPLDPAK